MGLTNFPNGVSSFGIPVIGGGGLPATKGNVYFVDYGSGNDGNRGKSPDRAFKTLAYAYTKVTSNNFDIICLIGSDTHVLTEMLTVAKNRVAIIGLDNSPGRNYGQAAKVSLGVTTAATDIGTIKDNGVRNVYQNIKFMNSNTVAEGIYCFVDAGEYTQLLNCEIYKSTDLNVTGAAELVCNGDSSTYINCYIGSTANAITGAIIRPTVLMTKAIVSGKVARDVSFIDCTFARKCGNVANRFVYGANASDVERMCLFKNCIFWNAALAAATPAQNVAFGASQTQGSVLLKGCTAIGAATAMSTTTGVFVDGPIPAADTTGIALQAT